MANFTTISAAPLSSVDAPDITKSQQELYKSTLEASYKTESYMPVKSLAAFELVDISIGPKSKTTGISLDGGKSTLSNSEIIQIIKDSGENVVKDIDALNNLFFLASTDKFGDSEIKKAAQDHIALHILPHITKDSNQDSQLFKTLIRSLAGEKVDYTQEILELSLKVIDEANSSDKDLSSSITSTLSKLNMGQSNLSAAVTEHAQKLFEFIVGRSSSATLWR